MRVRNLKSVATTAPAPAQSPIPLSPWPDTETEAEAAVARLRAATAIPDDERAAALGSTAAALVEAYADAAPQAVRDEACVRCAGWLHGQPAASVRTSRVGEIELEFAPSMVGALRHSGAMSLLSPFKRRRAGRIG